MIEPHIQVFELTEGFEALATVMVSISPEGKFNTDVHLNFDEDYEMFDEALYSVLVSLRAAVDTLELQHFPEELLAQNDPEDDDEDE